VRLRRADAAVEAPALVLPPERQADVALELDHRSRNT